MSDEQTKPSCEQLESQKLLLEIAKLQRPWWQEAAYLSALFPTTIALISVLIAWQSGLLDAKSVNLETRRIKLERDVRDFEARQTDLWRTNAALSRQSASITAVNAKLSESRHSLDLDLAKLKASRDAAILDRDNLNEQTSRLRAERLKLLASVVAERQSAKLAPLRELLRDLEDPQALYLPQSGLSVIQHMRADTELGALYKHELEEYLARTTEPRIRAFALQALALGSGDEMVADRLIEEVGRTLGPKHDQFKGAVMINALEDFRVREAISVVWPDRSRRKILLLAASLLENQEVEPYIHDCLLGLTLRIPMDGKFPVHRHDPSLALRIIRSATKIANGTREPSARWHAFFVLQEYSPPAFLVSASHLFTDDHEPDSNLLVQVENLLQFPFMNGLRNIDLGQPHTRDAAEWKSWRSTHGHSSLSGAAI